MRTFINWIKGLFTKRPPSPITTKDAERLGYEAGWKVVGVDKNPFLDRSTVLSGGWFITGISQKHYPLAAGWYHGYGTAIWEIMNRKERL